MIRRIETEEVLRDSDGYWTHSQLPKIGENESVSVLFDWAKRRGCFIEVVPMWSNFESDDLYKDFPNWRPVSRHSDYSDIFLLSIHDTGDGPCAWYAVSLRK